MKNLFFLLIFISENSFCQTITGVLLDRETRMPLVNAKVYLADNVETKDTINICYHNDELNADYCTFKVLKETNTDSIGNFLFNNIINRQYNIIATHKVKISELSPFAGELFERTAIDKINITNIDSNYFCTLYINVICEYDKTKNQKICPICKKEDKVLPIMYGLPVPWFNKDGIEIADRNGKFLNDYHLGGCIINSFCNPTKHCNRYNKDF